MGIFWNRAQKFPNIKLYSLWKCKKMISQKMWVAISWEHWYVSSLINRSCWSTTATLLSIMRTMPREMIWIESNWDEIMWIEMNWDEQDSISWGELRWNDMNWVELSQIESNWVELSRIEMKWYELRRDETHWCYFRRKS